MLSRAEPAVFGEAEDFRAHYFHHDFVLFIFSYRIPEEVDLSSVLPSLAKEDGAFATHSITSTTLVLRQHNGIDDLTVVLNPRNRRVGVLFFERDGSSIRAYELWLKKLREVVGLRPDSS